VELPNLEQGLDPRLVWIRIGGSVDLQVLTLDVNAVGDPNMKFCEFDAALESGRESLDDSSAENGLGPNNLNPDANGRQEKSEDQGAKNPAPSP